VAFEQYPTSGGGQQSGASPASSYGDRPREAQLKQWERGHMGSAKLASWPWRMASGLIDYVPLYVVLAIFAAAHATAVGFVITVIVILANNVYMQGTTGQSLGKRLVGTRVVSAVDSGPTTFTFVYPGVGRCLWRQLCHIVDTILLYTGYLRPLWQRQYRCWSDSLSKTVVLDRSFAHLELEHAQGRTTTQGL
jgi:uncharacterized RDD family membrane protein YckC